jgi:hypothetical protein
MAKIEESKTEIKICDYLENIIENQKFKTEFEVVYNILKENIKNKCISVDGVSVNKKIGLPLDHKLGFLIALYNEQ